MQLELVLLEDDRPFIMTHTLEGSCWAGWQSSWMTNIIMFAIALVTRNSTVDAKKHMGRLSVLWIMDIFKFAHFIHLRPKVT